MRDGRQTIRPRSDGCRTRQSWKVTSNELAFRTPSYAVNRPRHGRARTRHFPMNTPTLGEPRFASTLSHTVNDDIRIPERIEIGAEPGLQFEQAGPRARLFFDPEQTRAGIVTCGG